MNSGQLRNYLLVTGVYWIFTLSDGALRMLVLLNFYSLGYDSLQIALLFVFYELAGIVTNLIAGWIGSRIGLKLLLIIGLGLQCFALVAMANFDSNWPLLYAVSFVMAVQALSGVAKDLTKMSSKSAVKFVVSEGEHAALFKWVAILTGSKNTLKGVGFFLGGVLLSSVGYVTALYSMAMAIVVTIILAFATNNIGKAEEKIYLSNLLSKIPAINILSGARFFLFGARDIWFVVGLPLFLAAEAGWSHTEIGAYMASWIIGYGLVQSIAPKLTRGSPSSASRWMFILVIVTALMPVALSFNISQSLIVLFGLVVFGVVFAINSSIHSFLIIAYSDVDKVALNLGFYYMANAGGRLAGTLISGLTYQLGGIVVCLTVSLVFVLISWLITLTLPMNQVLGKA
jgi:predicted MFS family arabinose efflux permease